MPENPSRPVEMPEASHELTTEPTAETSKSGIAESDKRTRPKATRRKKAGGEMGGQVNGNRSSSPAAEEMAPNPEPESRDQLEQDQASNATKAKRLRGKPSIANGSNNTETGSQSESPVGPVPTDNPSTARSRRARKSTKKAIQPGPETEREVEHAPEAETAAPKPRQGRSAGKARRVSEHHAEPDTQSEEVSQEPEQTTEAEPPKQRRGQSGKKAKRTTRATSPTQEPAETETSGQTQRKPREPRGETVPVTVHRLANASALGAMYTSADGSGEEGDESANEPSTHRNTKLPNRGGVNPADVLSQICRETLEKTLATLKTGIENETNSARRAEWSRKRKAVETFGIELDGRLLDLSEMLDSNFVLGVQLKKAKRDMMDIRSHLHHVRQERESIALQMDRVRSKHMEEENEKTVSGS